MKASLFSNHSENEAVAGTPREFLYYCRECKPMHAAAAILQAYASASQKQRHVAWSEIDLGWLLNWQWSERTIATARAWLVEHRLLVPSAPPQRGAKLRLQANLEWSRKVRPADWENQLDRHLNPRRYKELGEKVAQPARLGQPEAREDEGTAELWDRVIELERQVNQLLNPVPPSSDPPRERGAGKPADEVGSSLKSGAADSPTKSSGQKDQSWRNSVENQQANSEAVQNDTSGDQLASYISSNSYSEEEEKAYINPEKLASSAALEQIKQLTDGWVIRGVSADSKTLKTLADSWASIPEALQSQAARELTSAYKSHRAYSWGLPVQILRDAASRQPAKFKGIRENTGEYGKIRETVEAEKHPSAAESGWLTIPELVAQGVMPAEMLSIMPPVIPPSAPKKPVQYQQPTMPAWREARA